MVISNQGAMKNMTMRMQLILKTRTQLTLRNNSKTVKVSVERAVSLISGDTKSRKRS